MNKTKCIDTMANGTFEPTQCFDCTYLKRCQKRWAKWIKATKENRYELNPKKWRHNALRRS